VLPYLSALKNATVPHVNALYKMSRFTFLLLLFITAVKGGHAENFARPFVKGFAYMLSDRCLSVLYVCDVGVLWPKGWVDQDETWHAGKPRPWPDCVTWDPALLPKKEADPPQDPQFSAHAYCDQTAGWIKMVHGMVVGLGPGNFVLDGDPALPPQKGSVEPQFSAHVYCGQTHGWIKMPLGTEVGLSLDDIVLDGDPAPPPLKGHSTPHFRPMSVVVKRLDGQRCHNGGRPRPRRLCVSWGPSSSRNKSTAPTQFFGHVYRGQTSGWMKVPLGTEVDLGPGHIVLDGDPAPPQKGHSSCLSFRPMSIVATVARLSYC